MSDFQAVPTTEPMIRLAHAKAMIARCLKNGLADLLNDYEYEDQHGCVHTNLDAAEAHLIARLQDQLEDVDEGDSL